MTDNNQNETKQGLPPSYSSSAHPQLPYPYPSQVQPQINPGYVSHPPPPTQTTFLVNSNPGSSFNTLQFIPILPMGVAVTLLIVNCILPGFGTMFAGMAVFCCADHDERRDGPSKGILFCINQALGWSQLISVGVFLIGWIWSICWGVLFITTSSQYYGKPRTNPLTAVTVQNPVTIPQQAN